MTIQISTRHMTVSQVIKQMVRELCREILNKYGEIHHIDIRIEGVNGPRKAGVDQRCHLKVRGKEHMAIDIDEIDEDLDCAIDNAFQRLKQLLRRRKPYQAIRQVSVYKADSYPLLEA